MASNEQFAELVLGKVRPDAPFEPAATYDRDGDCIEFLAGPDSFYGERVDDLVTVYYSHETGEIVGALLKGVSRFCQELSKNLPGFAIEIQDGRVRVHALFLARLWSTHSAPNDVRVLTYRKLIEVAEKTHAEAEFCPA